MMLGKEYILLDLPIKIYILLFDYVYFYMLMALLSFFLGFMKFGEACLCVYIFIYSVINPSFEVL